MKDDISRRNFLKKSSLAAGSLALAQNRARAADTGAKSETETIREPAREIPVAHTCDICVIGGSCTGVFAAVAAARLGAKVSVIENNGFFGGVATASLVNIWHSTNDTAEEKQIIAGLTLETVERLKKRKAVVVGESSYTYYRLNTEELKIELDNIILEHKVRPFLHTLFVAPVVRDNTLEAVVVEDKSGRRAIRAGYFIDATGDGDLITRMGLPFHKSDNLQPPTTCAILRGLDQIREKYPDFAVNRAIFDPRYPKALKKGFAWSAKVPGSLDDTMLAGTRVFGADCSDADQLTGAEIEGRRQVRAICEILSENFLDEAISPLVALPARIGIRETRRARCLYRLTENDVLSGRRFPDAVANGSYRVDIHLTDREGLIFRYLDGREVFVGADGTHTQSRWREPVDKDPTFYQIPYRCLVPGEAGNVLAAGRIIDTDPGAFGATRVMVNCNQTGEAAGTAAFLALEANGSTAEVDAVRLRETMKKQGSLII